MASISWCHYCRGNFGLCNSNEGVEMYKERMTTPEESKRIRDLGTKVLEFLMKESDTAGGDIHIAIAAVYSVYKIMSSKTGFEVEALTKDELAEYKNKKENDQCN